MGEKIDPIVDPIPGTECVNWDPPAETPEFVYVMFWDIVDCPGTPKPAPNGHLFKLTQNDGISCWWEYDDPAFGFKILFDASSIAPWGIELRDQLLRLYFTGGLFGSPHEHDIAVSTLVGCTPTIIGNAGFATIFWKKAAVDLITDLALPTDKQILFEFFMKDNTFPVYKFCVPEYSMNIKVLIA